MQRTSAYVAVWVTVLGVSSLGCATKALGIQLFGELSEEEEIEIGRQAAQQVESEKEIVRDPNVMTYVQDLGTRLSDRSSRPDMPYRFRVIEEKDANAFALPGGFIYVHRGIFLLSKNEGELAGVLAHEIGHVVGRHSVEQIQRAQTIGLGLGVLDLVLGNKRNTAENIGALAASVAAQGVYFKYSRDAERHADRIAVDILRQARINPEGMISLFERMESLRGSHPALIGDFFSSHPSLAERQQNIRELLREGDSSLSTDSSRFQRIKEKLEGTSDFGL